jgi:hypothetical protein
LFQDFESSIFPSARHPPPTRHELPQKKRRFEHSEEKEEASSLISIPDSERLLLLENELYHLTEKLQEKEKELVTCRHERDVYKGQVESLRNTLDTHDSLRENGLYIDLTISENKVAYFRTLSEERHNLLYAELLKFMPKEPPNVKYTNLILIDMFFFMFSTGLSCSATAKTLMINGERMDETTIRRWMDIVCGHLSKWGKSMITWPSPEAWLQESKRITENPVYSDYARKLFFFVDGSIIRTYDSSEIRSSRSMRNSKHGHPGYIFFIMVTPSGRVVYVSNQLKSGSTHDKTHMLEDGVVLKMEKEYPSPTVIINDVEYQLVLGGDKAYPHAPLPKGWYWYITKSGEDTLDVNDQGETMGKKASASKLKNVIFDPGFARLRSVVERSIKRVKGWPIFTSLYHVYSEERTQWLLLISIGLLNWDFQQGEIENI